MLPNVEIAVGSIVASRTLRCLPSGRKDRARKQPWAARTIWLWLMGARLRPLQFSCPSLRAAFPVSANNPKYVARATAAFLDCRAMPISLPIMRQVHSFSTIKTIPRGLDENCGKSGREPLGAPQGGRRRFTIRLESIGMDLVRIFDVTG
jgi:hypothetical protein